MAANSARDARHKGTARAFSAARVVIHHAVTVPSHVPTGLRREHAGGALRMPASLVYQRGAALTTPHALFLTPDRAATCQALSAIAPELDPRCQMAAAIGATHKTQRAAINSTARAIAAYRREGGKA